jgi:hypothetical protein
MSDLIKVQNSPQFNWYTRWTSLGANGMPDKLIKEGLKQPDWIEVSFKKGAKEITGHVAPNQAWFGTEYFLAYTLPNFKSKILTQLSDTQKDNGPLLFSRLSQCFQDVGLQSGPASLQNDAQTMQIGQKITSTSASGITLRPSPSSQHWQPADSLALYSQETRPHANAQVHAASSAASQLPTLRVATSVERWKYPRHKRRVNSSLCAA